MNIRDLIEELQRLDPERLVVLATDNHDEPFKSVIAISCFEVDPSKVHDIDASLEGSNIPIVLLD